MTSFVPTQMGIHRPPAQVDSSLLLQYCCHNPRGNNPCSFEEAEVAEVPIKTLHDSSKFSRIGQPSEFARSCALYFVNTKSFPRIHSSFDFTFFFVLTAVSSSVLEIPTALS